MGLLQRLIVRCVPKKWAAAMEAESRAWAIVCQTCGNESNVWDAGGIRYKAAGNPLTLFRCPNCGPKMHRVFKKPAG
jgi:predicted RNA-binding Zn-ribbon protein involved in translation (DUF1610 family)